MIKNNVNLFKTPQYATDSGSENVLRGNVPNHYVETQKSLTGVVVKTYAAELGIGEDVR